MSRSTMRVDTSNITWLSADDDEELPPPDVIAQEIVEDLQAVLSEFAAVAEALQLTRLEAAVAGGQAPQAADDE